MEQAHADAGFRSVAHHAQELARRTDQLGRANEQREARRATLFRLVVRVGRGNGRSHILAHEIVHRDPNGVWTGIPKAPPLLRTDPI